LQSKFRIDGSLLKITSNHFSHNWTITVPNIKESRKILNSEVMGWYDNYGTIKSKKEKETAYLVNVH